MQNKTISWIVGVSLVLGLVSLVGFLVLKGMNESAQQRDFTKDIRSMQATSGLRFEVIGDALLDGKDHKIELTVKVGPCYVQLERDLKFSLATGKSTQTPAVEPYKLDELQRQVKRFMGGMEYEEVGGVTDLPQASPTPTDVMAHLNSDANKALKSKYCLAA